MITPTFSARRIAELLAEPPKPPLFPTDEQRRMIEQPLSGSVLVVAGAGSGKTETMANRVVWLVANGLASPGEILGLTFTRKAAGELGERISGRLTSFTERLLDAHERGRTSPAESQRAIELQAVLEDGLELPDVSTYNSFASSIVQEFGSFAGVASTATLIDEAAAWRIARDVVCASDDPELVDAQDSIGTLVRRTLMLDHAVSDNLTSFEQVESVAREFQRVRHLPYNEKARAGSGNPRVWKVVADASLALEQTLLVCRLARKFAEQKQRLRVIEFSDQLALAVQTVDHYPRAAELVAQRSPYVLLDEVQDTSVGQTRLLSRLFAGLPVMAVGDPNQSIYGWRGASADNLNSFHRDFSAVGSPPSTTTLSLSMSWRNPRDVLDAANVIAEPLNAESPIAVPTLQTREVAPAEAVGPGIVEVRYPETIDEEYAQLAEWMRHARAEHLTRTGVPATSAVIFRRRAAMPAVSAALTEAGVPNRIVGVGGLLATPEVSDLTSLLRCVWYADAGSDLIRVLTGPRFRIGVSDIAALGACARWFSQRDTNQKLLSSEDLELAGALRDLDREFTIIDALDEMAGMGSLDHSALRDMSEVGRARLREAGLLIRQLRQAVGAGVHEVIRAAIEGLRLDIELDANEHSGYAGGAVARANLDAFSDLVEGFLQTDELGTLASVLAWLERVRELDQVAEHVPEPEPGTVQLITGHGSKGLEWDLVAIPRMVDREFPLPPKDGLGWLRPGELPDELRGDVAARPQLNWRIAVTQEDVREAIGGYTKKIDGQDTVVPGYATELADRHGAEERRLAYVAVTRAASRLLLCGSFWAGHTTARHPSKFLQELASHGIIQGLPEHSEYEADPSERAERTLEWPLDPLGARAQAVGRAAATVRRRQTETAAEAGDPADNSVPLEVAPTVQLLLAERRALLAEGGSGDNSGLPQRITASTFHEFVEDPEAAQRRMLRPLPQRPYRRTRTGNLFHEWVERRTTTAQGAKLALFDLSPSAPASAFNRLGDVAMEALLHEQLDDREGEPEVTEAQLLPLIENFNRSRWAELQPVLVEQEVTMPFAGRQLVCKLDAVYQHGTDEDARFEVVDWKTGLAPRTTAERESRFFQLDLYREAYSQWAGVPSDRIDVTLFYVADSLELQGEQPRTLRELETAWLAAAAKLTSSQRVDARDP